MSSRKVCRVVIIADVLLKQVLLETIVEYGAKGYNVMTCFGQGRHEVLGDVMTGRALVRIEVLTTDEITAKIMDFVHQPRYRAHALTAFVDHVEVDSRDQYV